MQGGGAIVGSNGVFHPAKISKGFLEFYDEAPIRGNPAGGQALEHVFLFAAV